MKLKLIFLILVLLGNKLHAQPFQIGRTTVTLIDTARNNRNVATEIYYPADIAGNNVAVTTATNAKFPIVSFGHGFVMTWDAYQNIWEALVPEGFIIAFPKTEGGLSPSHANFGKDLEFVLSALTALGMDAASVFYNRVDSMNCVMGHSMGGGSAFLAAQNSAIIKSLAVLAPAETNPSAIQASKDVIIPSLVFAGGNDCVTPPASNQLPMYDSLQSNCKSYISINGGSHCQMAENNFLCNFGEATCTPPPSISRAQQHSVINRYLIPWLNYQLKNSCVSGAQFDSVLSTDTSITFQKNCSLCNATGVIDYSPLLSFDVFPNPFTHKINVQFNKHSANNNVLVDVIQMDGKRIFSDVFLIRKDSETVSFTLNEDIPKGIYFLKATCGPFNAVKKIIKQ
jgi:alpha-beta hydrolase superfamily lysophospholipase